LYELIPRNHVLPGRELEEIIALANLVLASKSPEVTLPHLLEPGSLHAEDHTGLIKRVARDQDPCRGLVYEAALAV